MLLIEGVKYKEWTPASEDDFEQVVKEHTQSIFGEQSIYLDVRQKLKSRSGIGSIPDGYVIVFADQHQWHKEGLYLTIGPKEELATKSQTYIVKSPLRKQGSKKRRTTLKRRTTNVAAGL